MGLKAIREEKWLSLPSGGEMPETAKLYIKRYGNEQQVREIPFAAEPGALKIPFDVFSDVNTGTYYPFPEGGELPVSAEGLLPCYYRVGEKKCLLVMPSVYNGIYFEIKDIENVVFQTRLLLKDIRKGEGGFAVRAGLSGNDMGIRDFGGGAITAFLEFAGKTFPLAVTAEGGSVSFDVPYAAIREAAKEGAAEFFVDLYYRDSVRFLWEPEDFFPDEAKGHRFKADAADVSFSIDSFRLKVRLD
jgi:hypothetical protein